MTSMARASIDLLVPAASSAKSDPASTMTVRTRSFFDSVLRPKRNHALTFAIAACGHLTPSLLQLRKITANPSAWLGGGRSPRAKRDFGYWMPTPQTFWSFLDDEAHVSGSNMAAG